MQVQVQVFAHLHSADVRGVNMLTIMQVLEGQTDPTDIAF